ncbi:Glycosyltransferase LafB, responsible for the formation of Gal-Glc-DAG [Corynebacterium xerosis]|uniref:glycosyltransferase n=1 Tax=Brachybacterium tyrofermentans TaxID=47848 RepID=UPI000A1AB89D|nr:Glycosyltransferase LafB, responsible for the formation of Gal-Glc-DAG [Corynebacterium xerosis]
MFKKTSAEAGRPRRDVPADRSRPAGQGPSARRPLRVLMPRGLAGLAAQSGIGAAIRHQEKAVRSLGHEVVTNPLQPFDVVHLNTPFPDTPLLAHWARLRRRPALVWAHSTEDDFRDSFPGANTLAPTFRRWIAHLYRRGDAVVTPSEYSRDLISAPKYGISAPIHVLSNGVDTSFFRPDPGARDRLREQLGLDADAKVVVSVGMQLVRKGIVDWVEVARAMPEVTFVWYGRTDERMLTAEVRRALAAAPANARFPGYITAVELREAYCGADAFCFLTKEETEGIVLWEALACETPTLVRAIPIYRDRMPDGVLTHQVAGEGPGFAADVVARLSALLDGELTDLTAAGRSAAEEVDIHRVAQKLQEIYRLTGVQPHGRDAAFREAEARSTEARSTKTRSSRSRSSRSRGAEGSELTAGAADATAPVHPRHGAADARLDAAH